MTITINFVYFPSMPEERRATMGRDAILSNRFSVFQWFLWTTCWVSPIAVVDVKNGRQSTNSSRTHFSRPLSCPFNTLCCRLVSSLAHLSANWRWFKSTELGWAVRLIIIFIRRVASWGKPDEGMNEFGWTVVLNTKQSPRVQLAGASASLVSGSFVVRDPVLEKDRERAWWNWTIDGADAGAWPDIAVSATGLHGARASRNALYTFVRRPATALSRGRREKVPSFEALYWMRWCYFELAPATATRGLARQSWRTFQEVL